MIIFGRQEGVSSARMVAIPSCLFKLSSLNEMYRGKLVRSITLIPFEIFDDIWYTYIYISGQGGVLRAKMVALPYFLFELSPLNELFREKLLRPITLKPFEIY